MVLIYGHDFIYLYGTQVSRKAEVKEDIAFLLNYLHGKKSPKFSYDPKMKLTFLGFFKTGGYWPIT